MGSHQNRNRGAAGGYALIWSLSVFTVAAGIVMSGSILMQAHSKRIELEFTRDSQALQFARSGLTEALGWFRKQSSQPVVAFAPVNDPLATPPVSDTDDPEIGIMREFNVTGTVWGRYEVWKEWDADPDPSRLAWRQRIQATEISDGLRLKAGGAWRLRSVGFVYDRKDASKAYNEYPNRVIATSSLETDLRRMSVLPPGQAAINASAGSRVTVNNNGRVFGGSSAGVFFPQGTGLPADGSPATPRITGNPPSSPFSPAASYDDSYEAVFGVSESTLQTMADDVIVDMANFPVPVPSFSLVTVESPSIVFDVATPLQSTAAILVLKGDVVIDAGSFSSFSGFVYVEGNLTVRAPCELRGSMVVTGSVTIEGSSDFADIYYDDDVLNRLRQSIGNYRLSAAMRKPSL